jgi:hypothetical protein
MKDLFGGMLIALLTWLIITLLWYLQLALVVSDCDKYGMIMTPGKIYECRAIEK